MIETLLNKFTAASVPAKAGLAAAMLTLATVGAAATGVLPAAAEELISDVVEDATGIELPAEGEDEATDPELTDPDATDPDATEETTTEEGADEGGEEDETTDDGAGDGTEEEATEEEDTPDAPAEETDDPGTGTTDSSGYPSFGSWVSEQAHSDDKPEDFGQMVSDEAHRRNEARRSEPEATGETAGHSQPADPGPPSGRGRPAGSGGKKK